MKTITLTLSAGTLVLGPLLAATIRDHKDAIKLAQQNALAAPEMLELVSTLALACGKRVNSALTLEAVEQLVDMENVGEVLAACWGVSVPKEPETGEAPAKGSPSS